MTDSDPANRSEDSREHPTQRMNAESGRSPLRMVPGDMIGAFKIIARIGEGGFGVVFLAEQSAPIKRRVALKIIKPGMDTKSVIARFEAERQALALMDHTGIAKVFEAGETADGRPYFVMEYVKGEAINDYCDRHSLDTNSRLTIFAKVCDCVQHAHQKGIIHRDLKPGNILVTIDERDDPQPKVIDFGIAKATSQQLTEKTLFTEQGQLIGTPEYMSPEQAEMSAVDVDTRSDVYSLGVILYEILSGKLPFDPKVLRSKGFAEIQRIIREEDPPKPSTKLTTMAGEEGTRIAEARRTKLSELQSTLRKELEWIPLKALRKDRSERYGSAEAMGDDVRRYLAGEPLEAGPESPTYRLKKLVRRNKGPFIAAALVALALIAGIIGTTIFAVRAGENARLAEARAQELKHVADFQSEQLSGIDVAAMGSWLRTKMVEKERLFNERVLGNQTDVSVIAGADFTGLAIGLLNEHVFEQTHTAINEQFTDQPLVRAQLLQSLAGTLGDIGLWKQAVEPQSVALELRREHLPSMHPDTLDSIHSMGILKSRQGNDEEAAEYALEAINGRRRTLGETDPLTLGSIDNMGIYLGRLGRFDEALEYSMIALDIRRNTLGERQYETAISMNTVGELLEQQGDPEEALRHYIEAKEIVHEVRSSDHRLAVHLSRNIGITLAGQEKYHQAQPYFEEVLKAHQRQFGEAHPSTLSSMANVGVLLEKQDKLDEALPYYEKVLEIQRSTQGPDHPDTLVAVSNMGYLLMRFGRFDDALEFCTEAVDGRRRVHGDRHPKTLNSITNMIKLHESWHEAEPEVGHDAKAAEYSALLEEIQLAVEEEKEAPSQP